LSGGQVGLLSARSSRRTGRLVGDERQDRRMATRRERHA
jgi:hypothetical protein